MDPLIRIALIGNYNTTSLAHQAIERSLELIAKDLNIPVSFFWIPTESINFSSLLEYHAIWCVPGSPYKSMEGALEAIKIARENKIPFLGTCGGFQHAVLEYARNVLLLKESDHLESNPLTSFPLIGPLRCSLVGEMGSIVLQPQSLIEKIYGKKTITETFNCNYGVNQVYQSLLEKNTNLQISGRDLSKNIRVIELVNHPFFIATLYQPERLAFTGSYHPLIKAFVQAAIIRANP